MIHKPRRLWWLTGRVMAIVATVGIVSSAPAVVRPKKNSDSTFPTEISADLTGEISNRVHSNEPAVYIVRFKELPLALYDGRQSGFAAPERISRNKRNRLNMQSAAAKSYESFLADKQTQRLAAMNQILGRTLQPRFTLKHALNAVVVELTPIEAEQVAKIEGIEVVEREKVYELATDFGPGFIGAPPLWWDIPTATQDTLFANGFDNNNPYRGEGVVIGIIDTGYNSASPSFSAIDQSGYTHSNPLGNGNYLGQCNVPGISMAGCNNKVIGVYDFINDGSAAKPFSVEDLDGHGSHTASTAGGNSRTALYNGNLVHISGVAPRANLIIYGVCDLKGCYESSITTAIDKAISDGNGIVDVLNFSITGGTSPWEDSVSMAFLSATNAGIFVAAAAANAGKPKSVNNQDPWVTTVAASYHSRGSGQADKLAWFSSLGPGNFDVIKPDMQAPGVDILAAYSQGLPPYDPNRVEMLSGTSMASPHTAGAGALLVGINPNWTPLEIKSALMMSSKQEGLTKSDGTTPSDPFDRGSGSIRVNLANKTGLVLDETYNNFLNAEPRVGGDPSTLNLASMQDSNCQTVTSPTTSESKCLFTRILRNTQNQDVTWTGTVTGLSATVTPSPFTIPANGTATIVVNVDAATLPSDASFHFGELVLTPNNPQLLPLHMPMVIAVPAPNIYTYTTDINIHIPSGTTERGIPLVVLNTGGPLINVTNTNFTGGGQQGLGLLLNQPLGDSGYLSSFRTDEGSGAYSADDFEITEPGTNLRRISVKGFMWPHSKSPLETLTGQTVHFKIYANDHDPNDPDFLFDRPDGAPESGPTPNNPPVWSYTTTVEATGLTVTGSDMVLDLVIAGAPATNLNPGKYWLTVYPEMDYSLYGSWVWFTDRPHSIYGAPGMVFRPLSLYGDTDWLLGWDNTMRIEQQVTCGAAWLSTLPSTLTLPGMTSQAITVTADSMKFPAGQTEAIGYLCLESDDPDEPIRTIKVNAAQF